MERLKERIERRTGKRITDESITRFSSRPRIQGRILVDPLLWQRQAAKIGLAIGSHVYPPAWRLSSDAALLREWLHGEDASSESGKACGIALAGVHGSPFELFVEAPEHLLLFMRSEESTYLAVTLLGAVLIAVPLDTTGSPTPRVAWKLDPRRPDVDGRTSWDALLAQAAARFLGDEEAA
jgi:hypothetical protein